MQDLLRTWLTQAGRWARHCEHCSGRTIPFRAELFYSLLSVALGDGRSVENHLLQAMTRMALGCPMVVTSLELNKKPLHMYAYRIGRVRVYNCAGRLLDCFYKMYAMQPTHKVVSRVSATCTAGNLSISSSLVVRRPQDRSFWAHFHSSAGALPKAHR